MKRSILSITSLLLVVGLRLSIPDQSLGTQPATPTADSPFKILTHNVFLIEVPPEAPEEINQLITAPAREERAKRIIEADYIKGYDVVILNELFDTDAAKILLDGLKALGYKYQTPIIGTGADIEGNCDENSCWNVSEGSTLLKGNGGVAIVSKWPIEERAQYIFKEAGCDFDKHAAKGFAYVRIIRDGQKIHIVGTHLQAQDIACAIEARAKQFTEIAEWIENRKIPKSEMIIIGGDMNVNRNETVLEYVNMLETLNVNAPNYHPNSPDATHDGENNQINVRKGEPDSNYFDYIFLHSEHYQSEGWTNLVLTPCTHDLWQWHQLDPRLYREFSDHWPVAASFNLEALNQIWSERDTSCGTPVASYYYHRKFEKLSTCASSEERIGNACYPRCRSGYRGVGALCVGTPRLDIKSLTITVSRYLRRGSPADSCPAGQEYVAPGDLEAGKQFVEYDEVLNNAIRGAEHLGVGLCFAACKAGYTGNGPVCHRLPPQ